MIKNSIFDVWKSIELVHKCMLATFMLGVKVVCYKISLSQTNNKLKLQRRARSFKSEWFYALKNQSIIGSLDDKGTK